MRRFPIRILALALIAHPGSAQLSRRSTRVEVVTPKGPVPVVADGRRVLVYELHVTNFGRGPLAFREIDVVDAGTPNVPLASYRDSALGNTLQPVGAPGSTDVTRLDPGHRTVVYIWLALPLSEPAPALLRHRLLFDILDTADVRRDGGTLSVIDSIVVPVSREAPPVIRAPLDSGDWVMGSGPSNSSGHRRALNAIDGHAYIAERFAIDWVMVGSNGNTYHDDEHRNESFWGFGQPIHSVAAGDVVAIVDSIADNTPHAPLPPVTLANIAGNYVVVRIGSHQYATYAHLQHGSIRVRLGQHLGRGDVLGFLGNSGQSTGPHLHFQVTDGPSVLGSEGVPYVLASYSFLGLAKDFEENKHPVLPRHREIPVEDAVIRLP